MSKFIFTLFSLVAAATALKFTTDCESDPANTVMTLHSLDLSPIPIIFPGELRVTVNLTVNKRIDQLFLETTLEKNTLGIWTKLPCIGNTNLGSCTGIDACSILDRVLNGSSVISQSLGQQIDQILLVALGHRAHCPIDPETVSVTNEKVTLQAIPSALALLSSGDYRVTIAIKDDPSVSDNVGCLRFEASIATGPSQPVVG